MNYVREAEQVRQMAKSIASRRSGVTLRLYDRQTGDPHFADSFKAEGLTVEWRSACAYRDYLRSFDDVSVGLAPLCSDTPFSRGKSFAKCLATLTGRCPWWATMPVNMALFSARTGIISNDQTVCRDNVLALLQNADLRQTMAD